MKKRMQQSGIRNKSSPIQKRVCFTSSRKEDAKAKKPTLASLDQIGHTQKREKQIIRKKKKCRPLCTQENIKQRHYHHPSTPRCRRVLWRPSSSGFVGVVSHGQAGLNPSMAAFSRQAIHVVVTMADRQSTHRRVATSTTRGTRDRVARSGGTG